MITVFKDVARNCKLTSKNPDLYVTMYKCSKVPMDPY